MVLLSPSGDGADGELTAAFVGGGVCTTGGLSIVFVGVELDAVGVGDEDGAAEDGDGALGGD
eukprot:2863523-Pyramimonas_sp.AAC.1